MNNLDEILKELGPFGNYQIFMYILFALPLTLHCCNSMSYVFTASDTSYRCLVPQCENDSRAFDQPWLHDALPFKDGDLAGKCLRYMPKFNNSNTCTKESFSDGIEKCDRFVFETEENTMTKEFNLLCDENEWKRTLVGTLTNAGLLIGTPLTSMISDRFGRKKMILGSLTLSGIFGTARSFSKNYPVYVALEILDSIANSSIFGGFHIFGLEIIGPSMRGLGGAIIATFSTLGVMSLGAVVWLVLDWRIYLRILYIPALFFIPYFWILPESIRWLLANRKYEQVAETLDRISKWNHKKITVDLKKSIDNLCKNEENQILDNGKSFIEEGEIKNPLKTVLKSRIMFIRVAICSFCWIAHTFVYYGLSINSVNIAGNKYLNFIIVSSAEIPGNIISVWMVNNWGRKKSLILGLVVSGVACVSFSILPQDSAITKQIIYFIGKLAITEAFSALYILSVEIYPTKMRHSLFGFCSSIGRIGSMLAPQAPIIAKIVDPLLVFGALSFTAGALSLVFPETNGCAMPETIKDAEQLGKNGSLNK